MSSPWRRGETTSPSARLRRDDIRNRRSGQHSPYRQKVDTSPSSVWDEFSRLYLDEERDFNKSLDDQVAEQERLHKEALAIAAAEHERVRESAERARERVELEIERERKRREEEEARALDEARREKAARDAAERRRLREELEQQEEEQKRRAAEERELESTRARLEEQRKKDEDEAAQRQKDKEEAERNAEQERAAAAKKPVPSSSLQIGNTSSTPVVSDSAQATPVTATSQTHAQPTLAPAATAASQSATDSSASAAKSVSATSNAANEAMHKRYLDLHKRLKEMRRYVITEVKKNPEMKNKIGDWRRKITSTIGQLTTNKDDKKPLRNIAQILQEAMKSTQPVVDVSSYMVSSEVTGAAMPMSGLLVYLLNIFSKSVISQLINEASVNAKLAEPIGVLIASVFSHPPFKAPNGMSLIDILLAKYHAVCPILWGIYGDEKTPVGRARIGWWKEEGSWVGEQRHIERMTGLGAGFGAITMRNFTKSSNDNPYPPSNYWKALSYIVNTPPSEAQPTHFYVLKALIEGYIPRFVGLYGQAALVALRKGLVEFPAQAPKNPARDAVLVMHQSIKRDLGVSL